MAGREPEAVGFNVICPTNNHKRKHVARLIIRRTLNKYGYPLDKQQQAAETVMKQVENLVVIWAVS
ncbi:MAG: DUF3387 domain-containing protein [Clostridiales bacterium]|jgi:alanyl-tRNA synthetase|nr:DUF3387 domain-containing protein [Clostridiales bacterium]